MGWNTVLRFTLNFLISLALVLGYVCIGAVVFVELEQGTEQENKEKARDALTDFQQRYNLSEDNMTDFLETFSQINKLTPGNPRMNISVWTFEGAFYFCTTAITTIGTGNITPITPSGQWFCIAYVMIGIPLLSLFFGMTGYYLTQLLRLAILKLEGCLKIRMMLFARQCSFAFITWVIGTAFLCLYAVWMFHSTSNWTLGESIYFSLTTFSTIGFGDYTNYNAGSANEFPLVISSFVALTLLLPASSLLFSTTAELFQTIICPIYIKTGIIKKSELQRILAEDQLLYRYRKMKREMQKYETFPRTHAGTLNWDDNDDLNDSSIGHEVFCEYLSYTHSDSDVSCDEGQG